mmetsp:Transcript_54046/g.164244  ORF Transcript_54046/g.164244 Transcript_54046/m.164244 type:complete len:214 (+) Transcript_54046:473-1114(+)
MIETTIPAKSPRLNDMRTPCGKASPSGSMSCRKMSGPHVSIKTVVLANAAKMTSTNSNSRVCSVNKAQNRPAVELPPPPNAEVKDFRSLSESESFVVTSVTLSFHRPPLDACMAASTRRALSALPDTTKKRGDSKAVNMMKASATKPTPPMDISTLQWSFAFEATRITTPRPMGQPMLKDAKSWPRRCVGRNSTNHATRALPTRAENTHCTAL